jgi:hypothetical protein
VHYCKDKKLCKSYAEVAKAPGFLSGANKIPLGNLRRRFQSCSSMHKRDSVFKRIEWPKASMKGQISGSRSSIHPRLRGMKNMQDQRIPRRPQNVQISNNGSNDSRKFLGRSWAYTFYSSSNSQHYFLGAFCFSCSGMGHISAHCQAQWRKTGRKVQF